MTPHLQTGELLIITTVLLLWAGQPGCVCAFICMCGCMDVSGCIWMLNVGQHIAKTLFASSASSSCLTMFFLSPRSSSTQAVIALFCRQYDIIKDNDSNSTKEKAKRPLVRATSSYYNASAGSSPVYHNGAVRSSRVTNFFSDP